MLLSSLKKIRMYIFLFLTFLASALQPTVGYSIELTVEQRVERSLNSQSIGWIEMQLKNIPEGATGREKVVLHLNKLKKEAGLKVRKQAEVDANNEKKAREVYAKILRNKYLDDGLDIKVSVSGKASVRLNLNYPLFNDVWVHKFQKGSIMSEIQSLGFKQIGFSDNYKYNVVLTFK